MARVRLELPEKFHFATEIPLRMTDCNAVHLAANAILPLAQEARAQFMKQAGFIEGNVDGRSIIMADCAIIFKAQAYYGQTLKIEISVRDFAAKSCDMVYRMSDKDTGTEICRLKTGIVFFDYNQKRPADVPGKFRAMFSGD